MRLGDATVGSIGLGDVSLARAAARGVDATDVERAVHDAIEAGLDVIDVADDAERLAGDAVRAQRVRDRVVVACHVATLAEVPGRPRDVLPELLPARRVQAQVESSLRATRLDALPLAILPLRPAWRDSTAWPELVATCARLVREGKVLRWGVALPPEAARREAAPAPVLVGLIEEAPPPRLVASPILDEPWLACVAVRFHLCDRSADAVIAAALERKLAVLAREPLAGGALAGTLGPGVKLALRDDRHGLDLERIAVGIAKLSRFVAREPPAARSSENARRIVETEPRAREIACETVAELALRFVVGRGAIALPRLHRRDHIAEALAAAAKPPLPLQAEQMFSIVDS